LRIMAFGQRCYAGRLTFTDANPAEHVADVRQHQLDIAFITGIAGWQGCESQHLWSERFFAVLPSDHSHAEYAEVHLRDLADETFTASESAPGRRNLRLSRLASGQSWPSSGDRVSIYTSMWYSQIVRSQSLWTVELTGVPRIFNGPVDELRPLQLTMRFRSILPEARWRSAVHV
jgi:DNA-binding transcriptional LysR family regulator